MAKAAKAKAAEAKAFDAKASRDPMEAYWVSSENTV